MCRKAFGHLCATLQVGVYVGGHISEVSTPPEDSRVGAAQGVFFLRESSFLRECTADRGGRVFSKKIV